MKQQLHLGLVEVSKELMQLSHPPRCKAYTYDSMWAYGNHYQVDQEDGHPSHAMYDFGVACIFIQASHGLAWEQNIIIAYLQYVGVLKEIVVVNYLGLQLVLLKCSWILANVHGHKKQFNKMKMDYGWSISNIDSHPWWNPTRHTPKLLDRLHYKS